MAKRGQMKMSSDKGKLLLTLYDGQSYEEMLNTPEEQNSRPLIRVKFAEQEVQFDLSNFQLSRTDEDLFKSNYDMLNLQQLIRGIDSLKRQTATRKKDLFKMLQDNDISRFDKNILRADSVEPDTAIHGYFTNANNADKIKITETAINLVKSRKTITEAIKNEINTQDMIQKRFEIEFHKKFSLSFACLILFFIGAPLGAIIRKGGLGMPVVISVLFFIIFHVLSISGEKAAREGVMEVYAGMWLASVVLMPIGMFLTWKSTTDSVLLDVNIYKDLIRKVFRIGITGSDKKLN